MNVRLYLLQRATAVVMVPLIAGHLAVIFYATRTGLSAADILARTRGSLGWGVYYALFVAAASIHGAIGVRTVGCTRACSISSVPARGCRNCSRSTGTGWARANRTGCWMAIWAT